MMIAPKLSCTAIFLAAALPILAQSQQGGDLAPGGAPAVTMKSLAQIDPGTALDPADFGASGISIGSGHYYLTGNVGTVPGTAAAITITAPNCTLDLRGFSLIAFSGTGTTSSQSAIYIGSSANHSVTIRNGHIRGNWYAGVQASIAPGVRVENLHVSGTANFGIRAGTAAHISGCHVRGDAALPPNGFVSSDGITAGHSSRIEDSTARLCDGAGFSGGQSSAFLDCVGSQNGGDGFALTSPGCAFTRCLAYGNDGDGVSASNGSVLSECAAYDNGGDGISIGFSSTASDCASYTNGGDGIAASSSVSLGGCVAFDNTAEGFDLVSNSVVIGCVSGGNDDNGFSGLGSNLFSFCVSTNNGQTVANNAADGFEVNNANRVRDCSSFNNEGAGIRTTATLNDLRDNIVNSNDSGGIDVFNSTNLVIGNYAPSNSSFNISTIGGDIGPLEDAGSGTNPNANFQ